MLFEAYTDDVLYVNKDILTLIDDVEYVSNMMHKGINSINPCIINYDMNDRTISLFSYGNNGIKYERLIKRHDSNSHT